MTGWACCGCCPNLERFGSHLDVDVGGAAVGAGLVGEDGDDVATSDASAHVDVDLWCLEAGAECCEVECGGGGVDGLGVGGGDGYGGVGESPEVGLLAGVEYHFA